MSAVMRTMDPQPPGSGPFSKIFEDTWAKNPSGSSGANNYWGTKDLKKNCGKMHVKIPLNLATGDYFLRTEAIALHAAGSLGSTQLYMTCYQLTVIGGGSVVPSGVLFPGAYKATDPGIAINIRISTHTLRPAWRSSLAV